MKYLENSELKRALLAHQADPTPETIEVLWGYFQLIATNVLKRFTTINEEDRKDIAQDAIIVCCRKIERYHPDKGSAFSYFTTIVWHEILHHLRITKSRNNLIKRFRDHLSK